MHHLGVGRAYAGTPALILTDPTTVTVINTTTGQVPSEHDIDPNRTYRRNKYKSPGQWPRLFVTHQATHMSRIITRVGTTGANYQTKQLVTALERLSKALPDPAKARLRPQ